MLTLSRTRFVPRGIAVLWLGLAATGCFPSNPDAGDRPLPIDVLKTPDGWIVRVPLCGPDDEIWLFSLADERDPDAGAENGIAFRSSQPDAGERVAQLVLTSESVATGQVAPSEIKEIDRYGSIALDRLMFNVETRSGYATSPEGIGGLTAAASEVRIVGIGDDVVPLEQAPPLSTFCDGDRSSSGAGA